MRAIEKLLSHRLRGFSPCEHTRSALLAAGASALPQMEIDVRVTRDGQMFVWHDPTTGALGNVDLAFAATSAAEISQVKHQNGETILSLRDALKIFSGFRSGQKLCLDIKDYGFEADYLKLVREFDLETRVAFVSWIPQTLLRLGELQTAAPLILSCYNLLGWGGLGAAVDAILANRHFCWRDFVVLGHNQAATPLGPHARGFEHGYFCRELRGPLLEALTGSRGGICIDRRLFGDKLAAYCRQSRLQLWIFSVGTTKEFLRYASEPGIDMVFCDDAPAVLQDLAH